MASLLVSNWLVREDVHASDDLPVRSFAEGQPRSQVQYMR